MDSIDWTQWIIKYGEGEVGRGSEKGVLGQVREGVGDVYD